MLLFPDFQLLDVAGPLEVFMATRQLQPLLVSATRDSVAPAGLPHILFNPDSDFENTPHLDVLFVPGGIGIRNAFDPVTLAFLADRASTATYVTSVCTGALVLGAAGLLNGYRAATHWRYMDLLPLVGAQPLDERIVKDRNRITSGGVTAGIDFGLFVAEQLVGRRHAETAQLSMQYAPDPPFTAGHPSSAAPEIVDEVMIRSRTLYEDRDRLLRALRA